MEKVSSYALLNENNVVINVMDISSEVDKNNENDGIIFCQTLIDDQERKTKWKKGYQPLDPSNRKRIHFPGIGYIYDEEYDVFYPPQPYPSWKLNKIKWIWEAPIPEPDTPHFWDEENQRWVEIK